MLTPWQVHAETPIPDPIGNDTRLRTRNLALYCPSPSARMATGWQRIFTRLSKGYGAGVSTTLVLLRGGLYGCPYSICSTSYRGNAAACTGTPYLIHTVFPCVVGSTEGYILICKYQLCCDDPQEKECVLLMQVRLSKLNLSICTVTSLPWPDRSRRNRRRLLPRLAVCRRASPSPTKVPLEPQWRLQCSRPPEVSVCRPVLLPPLNAL